MKAIERWILRLVAPENNRLVAEEALIQKFGGARGSCLLDGIWELAGRRREAYLLEAMGAETQKRQDAALGAAMAMDELADEIQEYVKQSEKK